jgi:hypothetical protein
MSSYSGVPLSRLNVFPLWTFLQIHLTFAIEHMQVNNRVEQALAIVAFAACGFADNLSFGVNNREYLL